MFGGTNFHRSQFNLATQAERQPGSSFKPIVLAAALRKGIAPATHITSKPIEIDAGDRIWPVKNYEGSYLGSVDLTTAMVHSDNSVYAQLTNIVGPKAIVETAHRLGIRSKLPPTSRSASASSRSTRSTWPAPTPRSRTTESAWTGRS